MEALHSRINETLGSQLINVLGYTGTIEDLSQKQVVLMLSLQGANCNIDNFQILVPGKKSQGWHLNLEKFRKKFFDSKN
ncbi:hypothetical protein K2X92_04130 [Candidatus Gracilibacteria bacterium]|nr:hypothetical protein [Candidatus Gracilibacteria bacterium]